MKCALFFRDEWSRVPAVPRSCILSPGLLCILNRTINSRQCQGGWRFSCQGESWESSGGKVRPEDLEDLASQAREVESGWTAGSVNLSRIQRRSEAVALQSEVCVEMLTMKFERTCTARADTMIWWLQASLDCVAVDMILNTEKHFEKY